MLMQTACRLLIVEDFQVAYKCMNMTPTIQRPICVETQLNFSNFFFWENKINFIWWWVWADIEPIIICGAWLITVIKGETNVVVVFINRVDSILNIPLTFDNG